MDGTDNEISARQFGSVGERGKEKDPNGVAQKTNLLLSSCASITTRALSCPTLGLSNPKGHDGSRTPESLLVKELQIQEWLDRQILDHRARLQVTQQQRKRPRTNSSTRQELQHDLLDESIRSQQENMLWQRLEMASEAHRMLSSPRSSNDPQAVLIREALRSRDVQVRAALDKQRELKHILQQVDESYQQFLTIQRENRELWQEIHSHPDTDRDTGQQQQRDELVLATETTILKRVVQDILVGSGLDWYSDSRLLDIMMKLES